VTLVRAVAEDADDRSMAAIAWGGAFFSGPVAPAIVWGLSRQRMESLARRQGRMATIVWTIALGIWIPTMVLGLVVPAITAEQADAVPFPMWVLAIYLPVVIVSWTFSITGLVRALRSEISAPVVLPSGSAGPGTG